MPPTALLWLKGQYQNTNQQGVHDVGANMYACVAEAHKVHNGKQVHAHITQKQFAAKSSGC